MPVAATSVSLARTGKRAGRGVTRWASVQPLATPWSRPPAWSPALATTTYVLLPNGDYEPIRPGERGTVGAAVKRIPAGGRPAAAPPSRRSARRSAAPTERQQRIPSARLTPRTEESPRAKRKGEVRRRHPATSATSSGPASSGGRGTSTAAPTTASPVDTIRSTDGPGERAEAADDDHADRHGDSDGDRGAVG